MCDVYQWDKDDFADKPDGVCETTGHGDAFGGQP